MCITTRLPKPNRTPPNKTYGDFDKAYRFFNKKLFEGKLPPFMMTLQRSLKYGGYFHRRRVVTRDGTYVTDEIALNPVLFKKHTPTITLSILVHEMVHS